MHLGPPKTEAGRRDVPIPANVLPVLIDHLERFVDEGVEGWLFPGHGGSVVSARTLDRQWAIARETIGRPDLHFHDLRHTGLTLVAMTGATITEIKAAGGHDSSAAAIRYQHATPQRKTAIADALAAIADGRIESLSPTKGHAGGTTPAADAPDEDVSEPSTSVSNHPNRTHHARRHRPRRRKSPGHSTGSEERPPLRSTQDTSPSATSSDTRDEQPQRDSNPCRHLERVQQERRCRPSLRRSGQVEWGIRHFRPDRFFALVRALSARQLCPRLHQARSASAASGRHDAPACTSPRLTPDGRLAPATGTVSARSQERETQKAGFEAGHPGARVRTKPVLVLTLPKAWEPGGTTYPPAFPDQPPEALPSVSQGVTGL